MNAQPQGFPCRGVRMRLGFNVDEEDSAGRDVERLAVLGCIGLGIARTRRGRGSVVAGA